MTEVSLSRCPDCGAPIVWATNELGERVAIDADPRPDGNVELRGMQAGVLTARVIDDERREEIAKTILLGQRQHLEPIPLNLYFPHAATCSASEMFGRRARLNGGVTP